MSSIFVAVLASLLTVIIIASLMAWAFWSGRVSARVAELERRLVDDIKPRNGDPATHRPEHWDKLAVIETLLIKFNNARIEHELEGERMGDILDILNHLQLGGSADTPRSERRNRQEKRE